MLVPYALALVLGAPTGAAAQDAGELISRGVTLREQGRDEEAAELFAQAVAIEATPRALAQLGLAEQALGRWADAEAHVQLALDASDDRWIRARRTVLEQALRVIASHLGNLEVRSNRPATLRIDGRVAAELPLDEPVRLPVGRVEIEVVAGTRSIRR